MTASRYPSATEPETNENGVTLDDWLMLALAVFSVALLGYSMFGDASRQQQYWIFIVDTVICAVFAVEFISRWVRDDRPKTFPARNWYEILGMIPVSHPALRGFRLLRIVRIAVLLSRVGRAADRTLGERVTYRLIRRFKHTIADALSDAVTLRLFDEIEEVLEGGTYTRNLAAALESEGQQMHTIIVDKVKRDPAVGRLRHLPFFDDLVSTMGVVTQRVLIELLKDPRTDRLGKAVIYENLNQLRESVRQAESERD